MSDRLFTDLVMIATEQETLEPKIGGQKENWFLVTKFEGISKIQIKTCFVVILALFIPYLVRIGLQG